MMIDLLLSIPDFLRRRKRRGRPRKAEEVVAVVETTEAVLERLSEWQAIKRRRYGEKYTMTLTNELPRFGTGRRTFYVKEGRKWAHFTLHVGDPAKTKSRIRGKLPLKQWQAMKEQMTNETKTKNNSRRRSTL